MSALTHDPKSLRAAAETGLRVVLMHAQGEPKTMQDNPAMPTWCSSVRLSRGAHRAVRQSRHRAGAHRRRSRPRLRQDARHNLALLAHITLFHGLGVPLLIGASRKRFIQGRVRRAKPQRARAGVPGRGGRRGGARRTDFARCMTWRAAAKLGRCGGPPCLALKVKGKSRPAARMV